MDNEATEITATADPAGRANNGLLWLDAPTEPGWYWMRYWLSSKPAIIKQVHYFNPHFVIDGAPLKDWEHWRFCGPVQEP